MSSSNPPVEGGSLPSLSEFDAMSSTYQPIRRLDDSMEAIGRPVRFSAGQFQGRTLRAELVELQKADLGRKYARKDRRPLDPPPVVQLKLFDVFNEGTPAEFQREFDNYDDIRGFGLLCHIDLFPVPPQQEHPEPRRSKKPDTQIHTRPNTASVDSTSASPVPQSSPPTPSPFAYTQTLTPPAYAPPSSNNDAVTASTGSPPLGGAGISHHPPTTNNVTLPPLSSWSAPPMPGPQSQGVQLPPMMEYGRPGVITLPPLTRQNAYNSLPQASSSTQPIAPPILKPIPAGPSSPEGVVAYLGDHPIKEEEKATEALSGACFAQSACLEYQGRKVLMFVFSDIAVRIEGTFILRYRVFNIFARADGIMDIPVLAECYGGSFRIYSTKEFPGLRASTDLTKHLSYFGVRLNLRESERKRRPRGTPSGLRQTARSRADDGAEDLDSDEDVD